MDLDGDGIMDAVGIDLDGDGAVDVVGVDLDGDGIVDDWVCGNECGFKHAEYGVVVEHEKTCTGKPSGGGLFASFSSFVSDRTPSVISATGALAAITKACCSLSHLDS